MTITLERPTQTVQVDDDGRCIYSWLLPSQCGCKQQCRPQFDSSDMDAANR